MYVTQPCYTYLHAHNQSILLFFGDVEAHFWMYEREERKKKDRDPDKHSVGREYILVYTVRSILWQQYQYL